MLWLLVVKSLQSRANLPVFKPHSIIPQACDHRQLTQPFCQRMEQIPSQRSSDRSYFPKIAATESPTHMIFYTDFAPPHPCVNTRVPSHRIWKVCEPHHSKVYYKWCWVASANRWAKTMWLLGSLGMPTLETQALHAMRKPKQFTKRHPWRETETPPPTHTHTHPARLGSQVSEPFPQPPDSVVDTAWNRDMFFYWVLSNMHIHKQIKDFDCFEPWDLRWLVMQQL